MKILGVSDFNGGIAKCYKHEEDDLQKAYEYIRKEPDGKGGWNYFYKMTTKKKKKDDKAFPGVKEPPTFKRTKSGYMVHNLPFDSGL